MNLKPPGMGLHVAGVKFIYASFLIAMLFLTCNEVREASYSGNQVMRNMKIRPDTRHKLFAVFVSARREKAFQTDRRTDGQTNTPSYRVVAHD